MPKVGKKTFPYTAAGKKAAKKAGSKAKKAVEKKAEADAVKEAVKDTEKKVDDASKKNRKYSGPMPTKCRIDPTLTSTNP